ncbi:hypothetical protein N8700_00610 [Candidatus Pelagibacter sp.]|nr:hypothetical protein [Candidatus Pelagibacter sp.]
MKIKTFLYSSAFTLLLTSSSFAVVSTPAPSPTLAQVAQSMSYASSTNNNIDISETTSQTSNLIDSDTLQADVVTAAESAGLEVDTEALELLSTADGGTTAIAQMNNDNLENKFGDDYEATMDVNTMVFKDADWVDLEKQTTSTITGQTYSSNNNFFNNCSGCQQGRSATYINLAKGEISAKIWVRSKVRVNDPTSEGTTVSPEHHTGVAGLTTFPITGYVDATIDPDGTSNSGTFTEGQPASLVNNATTLAKPFEEGEETGITREMLMDKFNNGFTGGEDKIFMVAKGVSDGNTLTGVIAIEGGSCVDACTEQQFVESVERWENTSKLVGAKWDGKNFDF